MVVVLSSVELTLVCLQWLSPECRQLPVEEVAQRLCAVVVGGGARIVQAAVVQHLLHVVDELGQGAVGSPLQTAFNQAQV